MINDVQQRLNQQKRNSNEQQLNIYLQYTSKQKQLATKRNLLKSSPLHLKCQKRLKQTIYQDPQIQMPRKLITDRQFPTLNHAIIQYQQKLTFLLSQITPSTNLNGNKILKEFNKWNNNIKTYLFELYDTFQMMGLDNISFTVSQVVSKIQKVQVNVLNKTLLLLNYIQAQYLKGASPLSGNNSNNGSNSVICSECGRCIQKVQLELLRNQLDKINQKSDIVYSAKRWQKSIENLQEGQFSLQDSNNFVTIITDVLNAKNSVLIQRSGQTYDYLIEYLSTLQEDEINVDGFSNKIEQNIENVKRKLKLKNNRPSFDMNQQSKNSFPLIKDTEAMAEIFGQSFDNNAIRVFQDQFKQPLQKIVKKVCNFAQMKYKPQKINKKTQQGTQTSLIKPSQQMKFLEKINLNLQKELELVKNTKRQLQKDAIKYIEMLQLNQTKISQLTLLYKSAKSEKDQAIQNLKVSQETLKGIHKSHQQDLQNYISKSIQQKYTLSKKNKDLEQLLAILGKNYADENIFKQKSIQTQFQIQQKQIQTQPLKILQQYIQNYKISSNQDEKQSLNGIDLNLNTSQYKVKQLQRRNSNSNNVASYGTKKLINANKVEDNFSEKSIIKGPLNDLKISNNNSILLQTQKQGQNLNESKNRAKVSFNLKSPEEKKQYQGSANSIANFIQTQNSLQIQKNNGFRSNRRKNSSIVQIYADQDACDSQFQQESNSIKNKQNAQRGYQKQKITNSIQRYTTPSSNINSILKKDVKINIYSPSPQGNIQVAEKSLQNSSKSLKNKRLQKIFENHIDSTIYTNVQYQLKKDQRKKLMKTIENNYSTLIRMGVIQFLEQFQENLKNQKENNRSKNKIVNSSEKSSLKKGVKKNIILKNKVSFDRAKQSFNTSSKQSLQNSALKFANTFDNNAMIKGLKSSAGFTTQLAFVSSAQLTKRTLGNIDVIVSKYDLFSYNDDQMITKLQLYQQACIITYPDFKDLTFLFGSKKQAERYQKRQGFWYQDNNFLVVDHYFRKQAKQIARFFQFLKKFKKEWYNQYIYFLNRPIEYLKNKNEKNYNKVQQQQIKNQKTKIDPIKTNNLIDNLNKDKDKNKNKDKDKIQNTNIKQTQQSNQSNNNQQLSNNNLNNSSQWMIQLFKKILRVHKLLHKKCDHVQNFLCKINCYKKYCQIKKELK